MIEITKKMVLLYADSDPSTKPVWHAVVIEHDDGCPAAEGMSACDCANPKQSLIPASEMKQQLAMTRRQRREAELATAKAIRKAGRK